MKLPQTQQELIIKQAFENYFHHLALSAFQYVNDYNLAEDIVQDIFVKLLQSGHQIIEVGDVKGYLFKAVKNSCLNYLKHQQVRQKFIAESEFLNPSFENSPEENTTKEEIYNRIHKAVNKLPEHWREAFILSKYDQLKYHEIAQKMNISQKTVEKYLSKALHFLREELKDLLISGIIMLEFLKNNL